MLPADLLRLRLLNQQLAAPAYADPVALLTHLGAVQAQDYAHSLWAVGVRLPGSTAAGVERALNERRIVRTWLMRGTWHLVAAADVRWLLDLVAPRLIASSAALYRQRELDAATLNRAFEVVTKLLAGQPPQPRKALAEALEQAGIATHSARFYTMLQRAVLERLICPATRQGAEPTYALLDDWLPPAPPRPRPEAVAELARRYFRSHGPATVADFAGWGGLPMGEARQGLEAAQPGLQAVTLARQTYWLPEQAAGSTKIPPAYLLPGFDEYLIAYKDRSLLLDAAHSPAVIGVNGIFKPIVVVEGRVTGTWKRVPKRGGAGVEQNLFENVPASAEPALAAAVASFDRFWTPTADTQPAAE